MVRRDLRYKTLKFVNDDLPKLVNNKDLKGATNALEGKYQEMISAIRSKFSTLRFEHGKTMDYFLSRLGTDAIRVAQVNIYESLSACMDGRDITHETTREALISDLLHKMNSVNDLARTELTKAIEDLYRDDS